MSLLQLVFTLADTVMDKFRKRRYILHPSLAIIPNFWHSHSICFDNSPLESLIMMLHASALDLDSLSIAGLRN